MNSGSYLQRFQGVNSGASTPKDEFLDDNYSDTSSINKGRQLSLETNKRRRQMAMKIKENMEQEEIRRKEILAKRRQDQRLITEKFQRKRRSQSARKAHHQHGTLEDALQAVKYSGSDRKLGLVRAGSFDSLQARVDPWAVEQDARKNRPSPWEIEQEVLIKNNHTYLEKYGGYSTKPTTVDKTPQSQFEKKLEKHQNSLLLQQQKQLKQFSKTLEQAFDIKHETKDSLNSPRDSLEEEGETYTLGSKVNSSINSAKSSENSTYRVLSCEDLDPDVLIQDPNLFLPISKPTESPPPPNHSESANAFIKHNYVKSNFPQKDVLPAYPHFLSPSNYQADLYDDFNSQPNSLNYKPECAGQKVDSQPVDSANNTKSSKIPVPVSSPVKEKPPHPQKNSHRSNSPTEDSETVSRFVVVETEDRGGDDDQPSRDSAVLSSAQQPKGILKALRTCSSDSSLTVHSLKGEAVRDSIEMAHNSSNHSSNPSKMSSANSTAREQKPKSVRFAENLCEDLEEKFERLCRMQDSSHNGLPPRALSAPLNRARGKSSTKRNTVQGNNARPPRAPKRSTAPKMVSLVGMPVKLRSARPQKITSSTLDRLIDTNNENKDRILEEYESENNQRSYVESQPPESLEVNGVSEVEIPFPPSDMNPDSLVFPQQQYRVPYHHTIPDQQGFSNSERSYVEDVDLSVSEQGDFINPKCQTKEKETTFDPSSGRTPTETEIDQLWEHVRSCLKPNPGPDSATTSDLSVISAPNSFRRNLTSPVPMNYPANNAWTNEQQQNFKANQNRMQFQLSQGLRIIHHTSSAPAKRIPLSIQRETRVKQPANCNQPSDKVSDSLAEFLSAERLCQSPGDPLNATRRDDATRPAPQPPQNLVITRKRMVARQQMSPVSLTPVMSPVPQTQNFHPLPGPPGSIKNHSNTQRGNSQSALSVEEERIMKSLERLNDRLNTVTLQN